MPTFDYSCPDCGWKGELIDKMGARPRKKCPNCKGKKLARAFPSPAGLHFKGSGFYETDYKKKGK